MLPIFLTETELRILTEVARATAQSNGPESPLAAEYAAVYRKLAHASALAHRAITEYGAATTVIYNPGEEAATVRLDLGSIAGPPNVALKTLLTEAYETLVAIMAVGPLDGDSDPERG